MSYSSGGFLGAWPDSPDLNASPAQLYQEYVAYMTPLNPNGAWRDLDPAYLGQYLWDQIHPANLINTGQWGTNVGAIGATGTSQPGGAGTPVQPATSWVQYQDGTIADAQTGQVLDRVPGSLTPAEAAAARAVADADAAARARPIPEGFYLDPAVQEEWERLNIPDGPPWLYEGGEEEEEGEAVGAGAGLGWLALVGLGLLVLG